MAADDTGERVSRVFTVRLWPERVGEGVEYRGSVRAVDSGAFRHFRAWSDLTSFLTEQLGDNRSIEKAPEPPSGAGA